MADALLVVRIVTDTAKAKADLVKTSESAGRMQKGLAKMAAPAAVAVGAIAAFGAASVAAASKTEQAMGGVDAVFGKSAKQVRKWSDESAQAVGLSKSDYAELATVIGAQLKNMGIPMDKVAGQTNDLVTMGADLAAQYGGSTKEAVEALGSALRGETDPIERYGVSVKQADIAAQQAADGTDKLTGAAGKQAKTMALLKLVNKQTADAQGAFSRESDTAAGQAQRMNAEYENMKSTMGTALLPVMSMLAKTLGAVAKFASEHATTFQILVGVFAALAVSVLALNVAMGVYTAVTTLAASATVTAWLAAALPIIAVIAAVAAVIAIIVILWKKSETFRSIVLGVWGAIKSAALAAGNAVKAAWTASVNAITAAFKAAKNVIDSVWNGIKSTVKTVVDFVESAWRGAVSAVSAILRGLQSAADRIWGDVKEAIRTVTAFMESAWDAAIGVVTRAIQGWQNVASGIFGAVQRALDRVKGAFTNLGAVIRGVMAGASGWLIQTGVNIVQGLVNGINSVIHWVQSAVQALADKIPGWVKKRLGIGSPSKVMIAIGHDIDAGLVKGMDEGSAAVVDMAADVADTIGKIMEKRIKNDKRAKKAAAFAIDQLSGEYKKLKDKLDKVAAKRTELEDATKTLEDLKNQQVQYAQAVKESAMAWGGVTAAVLPEDVDMTADNLQTAMAARVNAVQDFANTLDKLRAAGLAESMIQDLAAAGVEGGAAQAAAIAAGGPAAIAAFNSLQAQLDAASTQLGTNTAAGMYQAGVDAQQGLVDGLTEDLGKLETAAETLATALSKAIEKAIRKALKKFGKGGGGGGNGGADTLSVPTGANVVPFRAPSVRSRGVTPTSSGGAPVNITVNGAIDPEATARQIRRILSGHNRRVGVSA